MGGLCKSVGGGPHGVDQPEGDLGRPGSKRGGLSHAGVFTHAHSARGPTVGDSGPPWSVLCTGGYLTHGPTRQ